MDLKIALLLGVVLAAAPGPSIAGPNPSSGYVSVTNDAAVCVRFHAVPISGNGTDRFDRRAGAYYESGTDEKSPRVPHTLEAAPGRTVVFAETGPTRVVANVHVSPDCASAIGSAVFSPFDAASIHEHVTFDGSRFHRI